MTQTTRLAAAVAGDDFYETGKPCRRGHVAPRYTSTGGCTTCIEAHNERRAAKLKRLLRDGRRRKAAEAEIEAAS